MTKGTIRKKGASKISMNKRKNISDSNTGSKRRVISKKTVHKIRIVSSENSKHCDSVKENLQSIIPLHTEAVTPIKRQVYQLQIPPSPFDLNLTQRTISISLIEKRYEYFHEDVSEDLSRTWFHHEDPWAISLTGVELKSAFVKPGNISTNIFDAIIMLLQEEDTTMYKLCGCDQQQWRHLLPPSFSDFVMATDISIYAERLKELFLGPNLGSNAEHCRLIMLPLVLVRLGYGEGKSTRARSSAGTKETCSSECSAHAHNCCFA